MRNTSKFLVGKREGGRPFGRHSDRLEDNIKINLK